MDRFCSVRMANSALSRRPVGWSYATWPPADLFIRFLKRTPLPSCSSTAANHSWPSTWAPAASRSGAQPRRSRPPKCRGKYRSPRVTTTMCCIFRSSAPRAAGWRSAASRASRRSSSDLGRGGRQGCAHVSRGADARLLPRVAARRVALAAGFPNGLAILWDVQTGKEYRRIRRRHNGSLDAIVFSPDGKYLATGGQDLAARTWDVATGLETHTFRGNNSNIWGLAFTPDNKRLITGSADRSIRVWELSETRHFASAITPEILSLMLPASSTHHTYYGAGMPYRLALTADGRTLAAIYNGGSLALWNLDSHTQPVKPSLPFASLAAAAFAPDGRRLAYLFCGRGIFPHGLRVWDLSTGKRLLSRNFPRERSGVVPIVVYSPDGGKILGCFPNHTGSQIHIWDAVTGEESVPALTVDGQYVVALAFGPQGRELMVGTTQQLRVYSWPGRTLLQTAEIPRTSAVALSRTGIIAVGMSGQNQDAGIRLLDLATLKRIRTLEGHVGYVTALAFSPDGTRLVSAGNEMAVKIWNVQSGRELLTFRDHVRSVTAVGWSGDGRRVASCSQDGSTNVYTAPAAISDPASDWPLLFAERFDKPDCAARWKLAPNWAIENGALKGSQVLFSHGAGRGNVRPGLHGSSRPLRAADGGCPVYRLVAYSTHRRRILL